ncbi:ATP-binding protein [Sphingobium sp. MK2]|uniref:ATP-binding protein n=1 Tax=Sphingobium sp. MK2 TaxID=3116540 RepID=UPI0032E36266
MTEQLIPFQIETERVIKLLATQIYQSPLALLRENTQNAFDAIRLRLAKGDQFEPLIEINLEPERIAISDNGIGMTPDDLREHYWKAGSSSKNNDAARAAGVVGTFGIGAMANFGIAQALRIETESAVTGERSVSAARLENLSLNADCISLVTNAGNGTPGTLVIAETAADQSINVTEATAYISEFVSLVDVSVLVNGKLVSRAPVENIVAPVAKSSVIERPIGPIGPRLRAQSKTIVSNNADVWISLSDLSWSGTQISGRIILRSGSPNLRTFRSGFGLATTSVSSSYQFGGVADLLILEPTAGREAITTAGMQMLQAMMVEIDAYVSSILAELPECDASTPFISWVAAHRKWALCGKLRMVVTPGDRISLETVKSRTVDHPMLIYSGTDQGILARNASDETPVLQSARNSHRRQCEQGYLAAYCRIVPISDNPSVINRKKRSDLSLEENALAFRLESILDADYFVKSDLNFGQISHGLPLMAEKSGDRVIITLDPDAQTTKLMLNLYNMDYSAFGSMTKDFVRTTIFQRISDFVPSSTRQGAEAFLRAIKRPRETFEYEESDLGSLPKIWEEYEEGRITLDQAVTRSRSAVRSSIHYVDAATAANARDVVPDVIENERALQVSGVAPAPGQEFEPLPPILRSDVSNTAKLLTIDPSETPLRGYRNFISISDRVKEEMGEFFLQPHRTSIVWGGQKTLFIFLHHSGRFGLYYDLQTREMVEAKSGGGSYPTATIVLKDRIYIPVPEEIAASFVPAPGERKRFEVRSDILRTESA